MKEEKQQEKCLYCGWTSDMDGRKGEWEHCPNCLASIHTERADGIECGGILEAVGVWVKGDDKWEIVQRCQFCGEMKTTRVTEYDNRIKLLSIAAKPLSSPPFPIEKMEELTRIMGGQGKIGGRHNEQRK